MSQTMRIKCEKQRLKVVQPFDVISGTVEAYSAEFEFSEEWGEYAKTAVFQNTYSDAYEVILVDNRCIVPWEVLTQTGELSIGVYGVSGTKVYPSDWISREIVFEGAPAGETGQEPTPSQWEQVLARLAEIDADVVILRERVDEFSIAVGIVGTYAELLAYDTSTLQPDDKVKVLADETHGGHVTYWKWTGTAWEYVGMIDTGYTKMEADAKFETQIHAEGTYETRGHAEETYKTIADADAEFEKVENETTTVDEYSTHFEIPTAKAVFTAIKNGIVAVATKLQTKRNLRVNLASTSAQPFDGSADATGIGVNGALPITNGGTNATTAKGACKNICALSLQAPSTSIPQNADLNDYTTEGQYYISNSTVAATIKNIPYKSAGSQLVVQKEYSSAYTTQYLLCGGTNNKIYVRSQSATAWGSWDSLVLASDTIPLEHGGTGATTAPGAARALGLGFASTVYTLTNIKDSGETAAAKQLWLWRFGDLVVAYFNAEGAISSADTLINCGTVPYGYRPYINMRNMPTVIQSSSGTIAGTGNWDVLDTGQIRHCSSVKEFKERRTTWVWRTTDTMP